MEQDHKVMCGYKQPYLPEEIITEILGRLDVKSIIRFRCVSKQWKDLINSSSFISHHLHHSTTRPTLLNCRSSFLSEHLKHLMGPESNGLCCVISRKYTNGLKPRVLSQVSLWNPATREFRKISRTVTKKILGYGFGFSAIVNDYKIVQIHGDNNNVIKAVKVFSQNTRLWKRIELGSLDGVKLGQEDCVTTNGCIFWAWKVEDGNNYNITIHSFDIAMEVFTLIPSPPVPSSKRKMLTVFEDKVAMVTIPRVGGFLRHTIDLWVVKEGGDWSWIMKFTSKPFPSIFELEFPAIVWGNKIAVGYRRGLSLGLGGTYLVDMSTNDKRVLYPDIPSWDLFIYVESLVPIGRI